VATAGTWLEVQKGPEVFPKADARVVPIFPIRTLEWPGDVVQLEVIEPAHRRLYEDFLEKGTRYLMAPLAILPDSGESMDEDTPAEQRQVCAVGALLKLTELKEVSEETDGAVKYKARHVVVGRARLRNILNPAAAFEVDAYGQKTDYLRGEVEVLLDDEAGPKPASGPSGDLLQFQAANYCVPSGEMTRVWEELRSLSLQLDEPRIESRGAIWVAVRESTTWQIASLWSRLQASKHRHRDGVRIIAEVQDWIEMQQKRGSLPEVLPDELDPRRIGLPEELFQRVTRAQQQQESPLPSSFYEPLLQVLNEDDASNRARLLLEMAREEVKISKSRVALKGVFR